MWFQIWHADFGRKLPNLADFGLFWRFFVHKIPLQCQIGLILVPKDRFRWVQYGKTTFELIKTQFPNKNSQKRDFRILWFFWNFAKLWHLAAQNIKPKSKIENEELNRNTKIYYHKKFDVFSFKIVSGKSGKLKTPINSGFAL